MVEIVFVHGVNTRREGKVTEYDGYVARRHAAFAQYSLGGVEHGFHDPYWGGSAANPADGYLPGEESVSFSLATESVGGLEPLDETSTLLSAARDDFSATVTTLAIGVAEEAKSESDRSMAGDLAEYLMLYDTGDGKASRPGWLDDSDMNTDRDFVNRLTLEAKPAEQVESLGLGDVLGRIGGFFNKTASLPVVKIARMISPTLAIFLGDSFVYLHEGKSRNAIRAILRTDLIAAARKANARRVPLIVMGHSMGANILYDMLAEEKGGGVSGEVAAIEAELDFPLHIDLFMSVGTQVGLFETLGLFRGEPAQGSKAPIPSRIKRWWHVYNRMDVLSFTAAPYFEGVEEFSVDTNAHVVSAHGAYFISPVFHKRLRKRLQDAGLIAP